MGEPVFSENNEKVYLLKVTVISYIHIVLIVTYS